MNAFVPYPPLDLTLERTIAWPPKKRSINR